MIDYFVPIVIILLAMCVIIMWYSKKEKKKPSEEYSYIPITRPSRHTAKQLVNDIIVRSNHHARESRNIARNNISINKILTISQLVISFSISFFLSLGQAKFIPDSVVVWFSIIGGFTVSVISIIQLIAFDSKVSAKNFKISQMFYEIKEDAKIILADHSSKSSNSSDLLEKYQELSSRYNKIKEEYIEYMSTNKSYYYGRGPGRIRRLNKIKMDAIDRDEDDIFQE